MMQKSGSTFLARLMTQNTTRQMGTAASIQARFEQAYIDRTTALAGKPVAK